MGVPNSVAADILQLTLLGGVKQEYHGNQVCEVPRVKPQDFMPVATGTTAVTPQPTTTQAVFGTPTFQVPKDKILIVLFLGLTTSLEDGSSINVNYGLYKSSIAYLKYKINDNETTVIGTYNQSWLNTPILKIIPSEAIPYLTFSGLTVSPPAGDVRIMANLKGVLVDSNYQSIYQQFESFIQ